MSVNPIRPREILVFLEYGVEGGLRVPHEVHLVDGEHHFADAQQRDPGTVPSRLREHALPRIDEDYGEVRVDAPVTMLRVYCSCPGASVRT